jgi:hypothetical protein
MSREDQYNVTVSIDGTNLGTYDKMSGGEIDSDETKYRPGNLGPHVSLGGSILVGNVTVQRLYDLARDHSIVAFLKAAVGKGTMVVSKQSLDVNGNAYGKPVVYTGRFKTLTLPDVDSESSDAALVQLEMTPFGTVSA